MGGLILAIRMASHDTHAVKLIYMWARCKIVIAADTDDDTDAEMLDVSDDAMTMMKVMVMVMMVMRLII